MFIYFEHCSSRIFAYRNIASLCASSCSCCSQRLDQLSTPIDTLDLKNCRLDNRSCEALEVVLSRMHMTTIDLERTNLEDDVSYIVLKLEVSIFNNTLMATA